MVSVRLLPSGSLTIFTFIPYERIKSDEHILRYYDEIIEHIHPATNGCNIIMKPGAHTTKSMRKRTIVQWLILDIVESEAHGGY
jgi:hypothetical protein